MYTPATLALWYISAIYSVAYVSNSLSLIFSAFSLRLSNMSFGFVASSGINGSCCSFSTFSSSNPSSSTFNTSILNTSLASPITKSAKLITSD